MRSLLVAWVLLLLACQRKRAAVAEVVPIEKPAFSYRFYTEPEDRAETSAGSYACF